MIKRKSNNKIAVIILHEIFLNCSDSPPRLTERNENAIDHVMEKHFRSFCLSGHD